MGFGGTLTLLCHWSADPCSQFPKSSVTKHPVPVPVRVLPFHHTGDSSDPFLQVSKQPKFGINPSAPFPPKPRSHSHPFGWGRPCSNPFLAARLSLLISFQGVSGAAKSRRAAIQTKHPYLQRLCGRCKSDHPWGNHKGRQSPWPSTKSSRGAR